VHTRKKDLTNQALARKLARAALNMVIVELLLAPPRQKPLFSRFLGVAKSLIYKGFSRPSKRE
jgi:hypothetical protein